MYVCERESAGEITQVKYYLLNRLMYTQNHVLLCFSQVEYSIFSVYHIQCLIGVIKRGDRSGIRGWRGEIIRAITPLTHLSEYQLASVAFIVCIYSKNHGYFI